MSTKLFTALSLVAVIAVAIPFVARTENIRPSSSPNVALLESRRVAETRAVATAEDEPQVVSLQVTPSGFEPNETIVPRGKFLILVQNRSGNRNLSFYLTRENQERLAESDPQKRDWSAQLQLGPGIYIVRETNHP